MKGDHVVKPLIVGLALSVCACSGPLSRTNMPRPPFCVKGGAAPISMSMMDYGTSYTPDVSGTLEADPESYLVPEADAGKNCVSPPWWFPPESSYR